MNNFFAKMPNKVSIRTHENPDVDAVISMWLMSNILRELGHEVSFYFSGEYSESTKLALNYIQSTYDEEICLESEKVNADAILLLDTNLFSGYDKDNLWVIDHHGDEHSEQIIIEKCSSNACLIYKLFKDTREWSDNEIVAIRIATCMDTMYMTSKKLREEDIELLNSCEGPSMEEVNAAIKEVAIPIPDFEDVMQNIKAYSVAVNGMRGKFSYISGYVEVDIPGLSLDSISDDMLIEQMPESQPSMLCLYDYQKMETVMFFKIPYEDMENLNENAEGDWVIKEKFDHIAARGTELKPYIINKVVEPIIEAKIDSLVQYCSDFLFDDSRSTALKSNRFATILICHSASKFDLKANIIEGIFDDGTDGTVAKVRDKYIFLRPETNVLSVIEELLDFTPKRKE